MKINKKITRILIVLIFILSTILSFSIRASAVTSGNYTYELVGSDSAQITGYTGSEVDVTIPSTLGGFNVTSIGDEAFFNRSKLTSISLPIGLTSIGKRAFYNCSGLTSISLPIGLTSIGYSAFNACTGLTSISLPGVTSIGGYAFYKCTGLTSISLPIGLTSIGYSAFSGCSGLTSIRFNSPTTAISDDPGTIPATTTIIGYVGSTAEAYAKNPKHIRTFQYINQDQTAPTGLLGVMPTTGENNDGKITGVNSLMEYKLQGATSYTTVTAAQTEINGLAPGIYQVRYAAKTGFNAGADALVVVAPNCPVTYRGAQNRANSDASLYDIRFLATIDTLDPDSVGFVFSKSETMPNKDNSTVKSTTKVYYSITASGSTITAANLGGKYIIMCTITGIPSTEIDRPIYVRAFSTKGSETTYTTVKTYSIFSKNSIE